ncbi:hypothetical protein P43SY_001006 [Pythium insidiosum]|uniref:Uncharacterized protein n=1 Tax=Pythium insidiosum TaxID=114742 RepID=A0AAD5LKS7_PYTIN|nr:hypothetical protein P43SY_001006 [Pythium insidiosum]
MTSSRRGSQLSTLAETPEEFIRLECKRRKNQATLRRRASISDQFIVLPASSSRRERLAQLSHMAFLQRPEHAEALAAIVERVRAIASTDATALGHKISPMDRHRFETWAKDVTKIFDEFEPSDQHLHDPLVQVVDKLQALQDGHLCLAEVAIEGRHLLEQWERCGVFDQVATTDGSSEDDDEVDDEVDPLQQDESGQGDTKPSDTNDETTATPPHGGDTPPNNDNESNTRRTSVQTSDPRRMKSHRFEERQRLQWHADQKRRIENTYAYQSIRERAAARVIKRRVLHWARSTEAFRSRVEEIQTFGNTTQGFLQEVMATSALQRRAMLGRGGAAGGGDIFDIMRGRGEFASGRCINFKDLMLYAKHFALFSVDHAVRRVHELQLKQWLLQQRSLLKLQLWWRKMLERLDDSENPVDADQGDTKRHDDSEGESLLPAIDLYAAPASSTSASPPHRVVRLVPKRERPSADVTPAGDSGDDDAPSSADSDSSASSCSDAASEPESFTSSRSVTPENAETPAFQQLLHTYLGLLRAAPVD